MTRVLIGDVFGRLTVVEDTGRLTVSRGRILRCKCDCGSILDIRSASLVRGQTKSCGCLAKEINASTSVTHGMSRRGRIAPEVAIWQSMKQRCHNPKSHDFKDYGARGIEVCDKWRKDFSCFLGDMGSRPSPLHTLERDNNSRGYEPGNCRWATRLEQSQNKRNVRPVKRSDGAVFVTMADAFRHTGVNVASISAACRGVQKTAGGFTWEFADA